MVFSAKTLLDNTKKTMRALLLVSFLSSFFSILVLQFEVTSTTLHR